MRPAAAAGSGPHKHLFHREAAGNGPPRQRGSGGFAGQACVTGHVAPCPDTSRHQHPPSTLPVLPRRTPYLWIFLRLRGQKHTVISGKEAKMSHTVQCLLLGKGAARPRGLEHGCKRDMGGGTRLCWGWGSPGDGAGTWLWVHSTEQGTGGDTGRGVQPQPHGMGPPAPISSGLGAGEKLGPHPSTPSSQPSMDIRVLPSWDHPTSTSLHPCCDSLCPQPYPSFL